MQLASTHNAYLFLNRKVTLAGKLVSSPRPSLWPGFEVLISLFITHCNLCVGGAAKHSCPDVDLESAVEKKKRICSTSGIPGIIDKKNARVYDVN